VLLALARGEFEEFGAVLGLEFNGDPHNAILRARACTFVVGGRTVPEKLVCEFGNKCVCPLLLTIESDADYD
jgi:hypothetical protein